jgi:hypothetical protein
MQEFTTGTTVASRYGRLGGRVGKMVAPPWAIMAFLIGLPKTGKSAFLQSNPDNFIFNLDCSSTTTTTPRAAMFPSIGADGRPSGDDGKNIILNWGEHVLPKIEILKEMARNNEPRPKMVTFDSLTAMMNLLIKYIVKEAVALKISQEERTHWRELHGPAAWDALYSMVVDIMVSLHAHGYGVYIVGHVTNAKIPLGDDKFTFRPELTITDGFYKRLFPYFEMVAAISTRDVSDTINREVKSVIRGVEKIDKRVETVTRTARVLSVDNTDLQGVLGQRVKLPGTIILPEDNAWDVFEKIYLEQASK